MMKFLMLGALVLATYLATAESCQLKVGAFKVEILGKTKMGKPEVVNVLKQIIAKYDIILIQDIRDSSETAIYELLDAVNALEVGHWEMVLSTRLGRTSSKCQYAFFYQPGNVEVLDTHQWDDSANDIFEREPFAVHFRATQSYGVGEFAFIALQAKPTDAVAEIDKLADVYCDIKSLWGNENIILGGNFDAGCNYVKSSDWPNIRLRTDTKFKWAINDTVDTTVTTSTFCPYDRLVYAGSQLGASYLAGSARVYRFDLDFNLTPAEADAVSDHYMVDFILQ